MVNVFGENTGEDGRSGNPRVLRKVIAISGKYGDYVKEIQASHKLRYPAYRIASEGSPALIFTYENHVYCLGANLIVVDELTSLAVTKTHIGRKENSTHGKE